MLWLIPKPHIPPLPAPSFLSCANLPLLKPWLIERIWTWPLKAWIWVVASLWQTGGRGLLLPPTHCLVMSRRSAVASSNWLGYQVWKRVQSISFCRFCGIIIIIRSKFLYIYLAKSLGCKFSVEIPQPKMEGVGCHGSWHSAPGGRETTMWEC
jgi:hypothetical protein